MPVVDAINTAESYNACDLYGEQLKPGSVPYTLITSLRLLIDPQKATKITEIYGRLDFSSILREPPRLQILTLYLTFISLVFALLCSLYQIMIIPQFLSLFETFNISPPSHIIWYSNYWYLLLLIVMFMLGIAFAVGIHLKRLFKLSLPTNKLFYRILIPKRIRDVYLNIIDIINYPLADKMEPYGHNNSLITRTLSEAEKSGSDLSIEIQVLLRRQGENLSQLSEHYIQSIIVATSILIIVSIFLFLSSAYAPIFVIGEVI